MDELERAIANAPAFFGLDAEQLRFVAGCAQREQVSAGTWMTREGHPAERFFLIEQGAVALQVYSSAHGELVVGTLHDREMLGWSWLFAPYRWRIDSRAVVATAVIAFDGIRLRDACESNTRLGYRLIANFAAIAIDRLQDTRLQLLDVYANPGVR